MTDETRQSQAETVSRVERHPGPFSGPDAELARACAMAAIPWYGNDDAVTHQRIIKDGIWNDHVAVQAALAAIHHLHTRDAEPVIKIVHRLTLETLKNAAPGLSETARNAIAASIGIKLRGQLTKSHKSERPEGER